MSFYIRKTGEKSWSVTQETWVDNPKYTEGSKEPKKVPSQKAVPREIWEELGFSPLMTIEDARARSKRLNLEKSEEKKEAVRAARVFKQLETIESIYVPKDLDQRFQAHLKTNYITGSNTKLLSHWLKVTHILSKEVTVKPVEFASQKQAFYAYFRRNHLSFDYVRKLTRVLNLWGAFVCRHQGQYYEPIPEWTSMEIQQIIDSYTDSTTYRGPSDILTPEMLNWLRDDESFDRAQYRWLAVTVWFGLRPEETDSIYDKKYPARIENDKSNKVDVLWVYQSKLVAVPREKRWKGIPAFLREQKTVLNFMKDVMEMKRPLVKTLRNWTKPGNTKKPVKLPDKVGLYGGRKGFTDLMLDRGQDLQDISNWMGHQNIQMTYEKYRNRKRVSFKKIG